MRDRLEAKCFGYAAWPIPCRLEEGGDPAILHTSELMKNSNTVLANASLFRVIMHGHRDHSPPLHPLLPRVPAGAAASLPVSQVQALISAAPCSAELSPAAHTHVQGS